MKKLLATLLALAMLCAAFPVGTLVSAAGNMLANGDFETGDTSGWTVPGWCSSSVIVSKDYGYNGSYGVGLTANWVGLYQVLDVKANTEYEVSFWVKGYAVVYFKDGNENTITEHWPKKYDDWTQVSYEVNTGSSTTLLVELNAGSNTAMVDNVVLSKKGGDDLGDDVFNDAELGWTDILDVDPADIQSVTVRTLPDKVHYLVGEELDTTGLTLLMVYGEDDRVIVFGGYEISGYDKQAVGTQTITVTFGGKSDTFTVTVEKDESATYPIADVMDKIKTQGRNLLVNDSLMLDFSASGIEFVAECAGSVSITFYVKKLSTEDVTLGGVYFTVMVDGTALPRDAVHLSQTGEVTVTIARGLEAGQHTFAIYRQTEHSEAEVGVSAITMNGTLGDKPAENKLYIEFVGDSISVGQCNLAKTGTANAGKPLYQDATQAYPFLTAQALGADYSNVSWSGAGCKYGYYGLCMQDIYPKQRYKWNQSKTYDFTVRQPHIVVLALGTNDALNQKDAALRKTGMLEMINMVRSNNPYAQIVWIYNMMTDEVNSQIEEIVAELGGAEKGYYCVEVTRNTAGGSGHPDVAGHQTIAEELVQFITEEVNYDTRTPVSLNLVSAPEKSQYLVGEMLDTTGMKLELEYDDGSVEEVTEGYTVIGFQSESAGLRRITIKYKGLTVQFMVEVFKELPGDPDNPDDPGEPEDPDEPDEPAKNGWVKEDGKWAYYENDVKVTNRWVKDSVGWCYLGADGYAVTNCFMKDSHGWCYLNASGSMVKNNWVKDGGKWYFLDANGYMVSNVWKKDSKGWVYLGSDGAMLTNAWCKDSQGWCYVGADGYAVTNCWKKDSHGWIWLNASGSMTKNAWVKDGGKWYFLDKNGYMVSNAWKKDGKGWVYLGSNGAMLTNAWCKDSQGWCYVGADGYAVTNCWKSDSYGWIYLNASGSMTKSQWIKDGNYWYYLDQNGYMVAGKTITIGGERYTFDASGKWID